MCVTHWLNINNVLKQNCFTLIFILKNMPNCFIFSNTLLDYSCISIRSNSDNKWEETHFADFSTFKTSLFKSTFENATSKDFKELQNTSKDHKCSSSENVEINGWTALLCNTNTSVEINDEVSIGLINGPRAAVNVPRLANLSVSTLETQLLCDIIPAGITAALKARRL